MAYDDPDFFKTIKIKNEEEELKIRQANAMGEMFSKMGKAFTAMQKSNFDSILNKVIELMNSPQLLMIEMFMDRLTMEVMPKMEPLLNKIASGEFNQTMDSMAKVLGYMMQTQWQQLELVMKGLTELMELIKKFEGKGKKGFGKLLNKIFRIHINPIGFAVRGIYDLMNKDKDGTPGDTVYDPTLPPSGPLQPYEPPF